MAKANLRSGSQGGSVSNARKRVCHVAVPQAGVTGAAVARCLGVTPSAASRRAGGETVRVWTVWDTFIPEPTACITGAD